MRKAGLKLNVHNNEDHGIHSHHFKANRWGNNGNGDRLFLGSKITADSDRSHEMKRSLLLGRKALINLDFPGGSGGKASVYNTGEN